MVILNCNNIFEYYCFYCIFYQINAALVNRRDSFKKHFFLKIYRLQIFEQYCVQNKYGIISGDFWHLLSTEESALI